jgi:hypothetical protein
MPDGSQKTVPAFLFLLQIKILLDIDHQGTHLEAKSRLISVPYQKEICLGACRYLDIDLGLGNWSYQDTFTHVIDASISYNTHLGRPARL